MSLDHYSDQELADELKARNWLINASDLWREREAALTAKDEQIARLREALRGCALFIRGALADMYAEDCDCQACVLVKRSRAVLEDGVR